MKSGGYNSTQPRHRLEEHVRGVACDSRERGRWSKILVAAALRTVLVGHIALLGTPAFPPIYEHPQYYKAILPFFFLPVDTVSYLLLSYIKLFLPAHFHNIET